LRQLCNLSFVVQAQSFDDDDELALWQDGLPLPPGEKPRRRQKNEDAFLSTLGRVG
jgi:hypothetical protein